MSAGSTMDSRTLDLSAFVASPLDNFFNYVPKEHENAVRHAVYNVLAFASLLVIVVGGYYVLVVLNPFVVPLLWATLTGFVLHPYKTEGSKFLRSALDAFRRSESGAAVTVVGLLLTVCDAVCDALGGYVVGNAKFLLASCLAVGAAWLLYSFQTAVIVFLRGLFQFDIASATLVFVDGVSAAHLAALWAVFVLSLLFLYKEGNMLVLQSVSVVLWSLVGAYVLSCLWTPLVYAAAIAFACAKIYSAATSDPKSSADVDETTAGDATVKPTGTDESDSSAAPTSEQTPNVLRRFVGWSKDVLFGGSPGGSDVLDDDEGGDDEVADESIGTPEGEDTAARMMNKIEEVGEEVSDKEEAIRDEQKKKEDKPDGAEKDPKSTEQPQFSSTPTVIATCEESATTKAPSVEVMRHPGVTALIPEKSQQQNRLSPTPVTTSTTASSRLGRHSRRPHLENVAIGPTPNASSALRRTAYSRSRSSRGGGGRRRRRFDSLDLGNGAGGAGGGRGDASGLYLKAVFAAFVLFQLYTHPHVLVLLPFPFSYFLLKRALLYFGLMPRLVAAYEACRTWLAGRRDVIVPTFPVGLVLDQIYAVERQLLAYVSACVDPIVTSLLIFLMIIAVVTLGALVTLELYAESAHLVQTGRRVLFEAGNSTVFRQLNESIYDPGYQDGLDNVLHSVYNSGREYISSTVQSVLSEGNSQKEVADEIEAKVLELWDHMYEYWKTRKQNVVPMTPTSSTNTSFFGDVQDKLMESR